MTAGSPRGDDLLRLEGAVWLWTRPVGLAAYDLAFDRLFAVDRPWDRPPVVEAAARVGALGDYAADFEALRADGRCRAPVGP